MNWVRKAMWLPGKAFHVAVLIWYQAGLKCSYQTRVSTKQMRDCGISRGVMYHALTALENAGLIKVERHAGLQPRVTIQEVASEAETDTH
jgi:DNA-binding PadR family transcriptional regulator